MRLILGLALLSTMGLLTSGAFAQDGKIDAKKLVGKWTPKDEAKTGKVFIEFTKDGKVVVNGKIGDNEIKFDGTYKLEGNKLSLTMKKGDMSKSATMTLSKLTDTELEGEDESGKKETLLRVKGKK